MMSKYFCVFLIRVVLFYLFDRVAPLCLKNVTEKHLRGTLDSRILTNSYLEIEGIMLSIAKFTIYGADGVIFDCIKEFQFSYILFNKQ